MILIKNYELRIVSLVILFSLPFGKGWDGLYAQTILGVDVSSFQGNPAWASVKSSGISFAYAKATEGNYLTDGSFVYNMTNGMAAGVVMGAYHFADPVDDAAADDANYFLSVAAPYIKAGYLPPALDLEDTPGDATLSTAFTGAQLTAWVQTWCTTVQNATGITPVVYTDQSYAAYLTSAVNAYGLWIADYDYSATAPPASTGVWTTWDFKQYSDAGTISGISGSVDLDVYNGSTAGFNMLIAGTRSFPTTSITAPTGWITQNFNVSFTDKDSNSSIATRFYQAIWYNGYHWYANFNKGFYYDDFDSVGINPDWVSYTGTWKDSSSVALEQMDESVNNTNISAPLTQNLSNVYLYKWMQMINGTGTNRRAGFHFFVDNPDSSNRNNSYFVWFRLDDQEFQLYKVVNNNFGNPLVNIPLTFSAGKWYPVSVMYDRITGVISTFFNDTLINTYTDTTPIANGGYISYRSGNSAYWVKDLRVYRSRSTGGTITVGPGEDLEFQNPNPKTSAGIINSIVIDSNNTFSPIVSDYLNIDWTCPLNIAYVNNGTGTNIDSTYSTTQLSANWAATTDPNSHIAYYSYAIGTSSGDSNTVAWTKNGTSTAFTKTGLSLTVGQKYYTSVRATDSAGLATANFTSSGIIVLAPLGIAVQANSIISSIFPNPFNQSFTIDYNLDKNEPVTIYMYDMLGRRSLLYSAGNEMAGQHTLNINTGELGIAKGMYIIQFRTNSGSDMYRVIAE
ncbi:MAG: GH25 family lysozyme [Bacteroidia bacterium]